VGEVEAVSPAGGPWPFAGWTRMLLPSGSGIGDFDVEPQRQDAVQCRSQWRAAFRSLGRGGLWVAQKKRRKYTSS